MEKTFKAVLRAPITASVFAGLLVAGCASKPLNVAYNRSDFGQPDPVLVAKMPDVITPGDKIGVTVFGVASLTGEFEVEENGQIDYPLVGIVNAAGHTPSAFAKVLAERLKKDSLRNPNVQVAVLKRAEQTIAIEGAVAQPAVVPIRGETTLLQAIAMARGTTQEANLSQIVVFRRLRGERTAAAFDLRAIRRGESPDPVLYPNDVVVVAGRSETAKMIDKVLQAVPILGMFRPY